jgi:predicted metal-dependent HD superfamily phosphohydrolase
VQLRDIFIETVAGYSSNKALINSCRTEIEQNYTDAEMHYHNLQHRENLLQLLDPHARYTLPARP